MPEKDKVATCQRSGCEEPLRGRQKRYCSPTCRVNAWYETEYSGRSAEELLAGLPQEELRKVIRRVCERRWPGKRGRWRTRFGKPGMEPGGPGPRS